MRGVDPNTAISGPSLARQQNAIEMAFCWRADVGPTSNAGLVFQGIRTSITKKTLYFSDFFFFFGGGGWCPDPMNPHMVCMCKRTTRNTQS